MSTTDDTTAQTDEASTAPVDTAGSSDDAGSTDKAGSTDNGGSPEKAAKKATRRRSTRKKASTSKASTSEAESSKGAKAESSKGAKAGAAKKTTAKAKKAAADEGADDGTTADETTGDAGASSDGEEIAAASTRGAGARRSTAKKATTRKPRAGRPTADDRPTDDESPDDAAPDHTTSGDKAPGDATDEGDEERVGRRTRVRTRSGSTSAKADAPNDDDHNDDDQNADDQNDDGSKASGSSASSGSGSSDDSDDRSEGSDDADSDDDNEGDASGERGDGSRSRRRRGSRGGRSRGRGGRGGGGGGGGGGADSGKDDEVAADDDEPRSKADRETEQAIAKGGTRMAAKRRGRGGGSGSGGGSGGGGGRRGPQGVSEEERRAILNGPPRTMLVTHKGDRTQIVVMEDRRAVEHYVTHKDDVTFVGNIYMARVQNVLPGMEAAFLDIGKGRNGVLYAGEVLYDEQDLDDGETPRIEDTLKPGQKVLVQVTKDPMGTKGPRLTQHLSLAGRYMVLAPNSNVFGISRKLTDKDRDRLRRIVKKVKPEQHGIIVRTAAENATDEALEADLTRLLAKWEKVEAAAADAKPMSAVYEEPQLVVKVIRDNFGPDFERCIVDDKILYEEVREYLGEVAAELLDKVEVYDPTPVEDEEPRTLFEAYNVAEQLRKATDRKVWLPSGGYLIIETTEAMKVIDVNTGKFTGSKDTSLEEVVLKTNLEAADEIVRQLRLRDMGGIVIIDFIDMLLKANQDQVIRRLKRELLRDRTKTRVSEVSRLGLVQMTRKNVSQGLVESFSSKCDKCNGVGRIVDLPE